jgi:hypothetical protein
MQLIYEEFMFRGQGRLPGDASGKTYPITLCGLCGNFGMVDTVGKLFSPAGVACGVRVPCLCPNGRSIKKQLDAGKPKKRTKRTGEGLMRFWLSWNETSHDYRPVRSPPNPAVLGWWCSGEAGDGSYFTLVAWVEAKNEKGAKAAIQKDWPLRGREWRFVEEREPDWLPGDRFPLSDWSKKRIAKTTPTPEQTP